MKPPAKPHDLHIHIHPTRHEIHGVTLDTGPEDHQDRGL